MRFQKDHEPSFQNAHVGQWGSVYRRDLAIQLKAASIHVEEYEDLPVEIKATMGVLSKDDKLKNFRESRQDDDAFFMIIYDCMNMYTVEGGRQKIDDYARNEGTTWAVMRKAF